MPASRLPAVLRTQQTTGDLVSRPFLGKVDNLTGVIYDDREANADLRWPYSRDVYDAMRVDSQVHGLIQAVKRPLVAAPRLLDADGCDEKVVEAVRQELGIPKPGETLSRKRTHGIKFDGFLDEVFTVLIYGHAVFEQVYKNGPVDDVEETIADATSGKKPKRPDTINHIHKLAYVHPKLIEDWHIDRFGSLHSIKVRVIMPNDTDDYITVPITTLVVFNVGKLGSNWWGESFLRPLYKDWYFKDLAERLGMVAVDRGAVGVPHVKYGPGGTKTDAVQIARNLRSGDSTFVVSEIGAYEIDIIGMREGDIVKTLPYVEHHQQQMSKAWMGQIMDLGHDGGLGSGNLSQTYFRFFAEGVNAIGRVIAETITEHIIRDFVAINFGADEPYPSFRFSTVTPEATYEALQGLVSAGLLTPDEVMEKAVRESYGLPGLQPGMRSAYAAQQAQQQADAQRTMNDAMPPDPAAGGGGGGSFFGDPSDTTMLRAPWQGDLHPRGGKGTQQGGKFVKKGSTGTPVLQRTKPQAPTKTTQQTGDVKTPGGKSTSDLVAAVEKAGFTYAPYGHLTPGSGCMVSPYPDREMALDRAPTPQEILKFMISNQDLLTKPEHYIGGWLDEQSGKSFLDVSVRAADAKHAEELCAKHNQYGYFDLTKGEYVEVAGRRDAEAAKQTDTKPADQPAADAKQPDIAPRERYAVLTDLNRGEETSTTIHALDDLVTAMAADKGGSYNLNLLDIEERPGVFTGLGIPRGEMPQLSAKGLAQWIEKLRTEGINVTQEDIDPATLRASQSQLDGAKTGGIMAAGTYKQTPILATSDGWVIDGHHRWTAATAAHDTLPGFRINLPIRDALKRAYDFMVEIGEKPKKFGQK